jgi:acyl-coenzyme A thioesterase PaaI-like protein
MNTQNDLPDAAAFAALRGAILRVPYVQMLGFDVTWEATGLLGHLPFAEHLIGNPLVPALHGGVIAALLHFTAAAQLMLETQSETIPQILTCTIEYLGSPDLQDSHASATVISQSRRFANLRASATQPYSGKLIAAATMQFLNSPAG